MRTGRRLRPLRCRRGGTARLAGAAGVVLACSAVVLLGAAGPALAGPPPAPQPLRVASVNTAAFPRVSLDVTLPPALAATQPGPGAFSVAEAGSSRPTSAVRLSGSQLEVGVLIDTSGSMYGTPITDARAAAIAFLAGLPSGTKALVIGIGPVPRLIAPLSSNLRRAETDIASLQAYGNTALYDSVGLALADLPPVAGVDRSIVVLSDGGDTDSHLSLPAVAARVAASGVTLDAISLQTPDSDPHALATLAAAGHGRVLPVSDTTALRGVFATISSAIQAEYRVSFVASGHGLTNLTVTLRAAGATAAASLAVRLPGVAPHAPPPRPPVPARTPARSHAGGAPGLAGGVWELVVGVLAVFAALLLGGLLLAVPAKRFGAMAVLAGVGPTGAGGTRNAARRPLSGMVDRANRLVGRALRRSRWRPGIDAALEGAGISLRPEEAVVMGICAMAVALVVGIALGGIVLGAILAVATLVVGRLWLAHMGSRRRAQFNEQLGDTLQLVAGTLRAGFGLAQAVDTVAREAESPTAEEFRRLTIETRLGQDLSVALQSMAARVGSDDLRWVTQAIDIHREVGGDLAEVLDNVAGTIRAREQLRRRVKSLSADGRISAVVLVALPLLLAAAVSLISPGYLVPMLHGAGLVALVGGAVLMVIGGLWLRRIIRPLF